MSTDLLLGRGSRAEALVRNFTEIDRATVTSLAAILRFTAISVASDLKYFGRFLELLTSDSSDF